MDPVKLFWIIPFIATYIELYFCTKFINEISKKSNVTKERMIISAITITIIWALAIGTDIISSMPS